MTKRTRRTHSKAFKAIVAVDHGVIGLAVPLSQETQENEPPGKPLQMVEIVLGTHG
jgi:hypothetical protein